MKFIIEKRGVGYTHRRQVAFVVPADAAAQEFCTTFEGEDFNAVATAVRSFTHTVEVARKRDFRAHAEERTVNLYDVGLGVNVKFNSAPPDGRVVVMVHKDHLEFVSGPVDDAANRVNGVVKAFKALPALTEALALVG